MNLGEVDRTVEVRTPESIAFSDELAGLGSRFLALVGDQAFSSQPWAPYLPESFSRHRVCPSTSHPPTQPRSSAKASPLRLIITVAFAVLFGYLILSEAIWTRQLPGKRLLGLRVVRDGGYPIDFGASLIRNLIRVGEALLGYDIWPRSAR